MKTGICIMSDEITKNLIDNFLKIIEEKIQEIFRNQFNTMVNLQNNLHILMNFFEKYQGATLLVENYQYFTNTNCYDEIMKIAYKIIENKNSDFKKYFEMIGNNLRSNFSEDKSKHKKFMKKIGDGIKIGLILSEINEISETIILFLSNVENKIASFNKLENKIHLLDLESYKESELKILKEIFSNSNDDSEQFIQGVSKMNLENEKKTQISQIIKHHFASLKISEEFLTNGKLKNICFNISDNICNEWAKLLARQICGFVSNRILSPAINKIITTASTKALDYSNKLIKMKLRSKRHLTETQQKISAERQEILNGNKASMKVIELMSDANQVILFHFDPKTNEVKSVMREPLMKKKNAKEPICMGYDGEGHIYPLTQVANSNKLMQAGEFDCAYTAFLYCIARRKGKSDLDAMAYSVRPDKIAKFRGKIADKLVKKWTNLENKNISSEAKFGNKKKRNIAQLALACPKDQRKKLYSKTFKNVEEYKMEHSIIRFRKTLLMAKVLAGLKTKADKVDKGLFPLIKIEEGSQTQNDKDLRISKKNLTKLNKSDTIKACNALDDKTALNSLTHLNSNHTLGLHIDTHQFKERLLNLRKNNNLSEKQTKRIGHLEFMLKTVDNDLGHTILGPQGYNLGWERGFDVYQAETLNKVHKGLLKGTLDKASLSHFVFKSRDDLITTLHTKSDKDSHDVIKHLSGTIKWNEKLKIIEYKYQD